MTLYIGSPKDIRKSLELTSEFCKVAGHKSIHRYYFHSYILTMKKSEREIKMSISFTITTKIIKYLGINISKETKVLHTDNYKTLMKEIKDDINRWRDLLCS